MNDAPQYIVDMCVYGLDCSFKATINHNATWQQLPKQSSHPFMAMIDCSVQAPMTLLKNVHTLIKQCYGFKGHSILLQCILWYLEGIFHPNNMNMRLYVIMYHQWPEHLYYNVYTCYCICCGKHYLEQTSYWNLAVFLCLFKCFLFLQRWCDCALRLHMSLCKYSLALGRLSQTKASTMHNVYCCMHAAAIVH